MMRIKLRVGSVTPSHTTLTLFIDGGNCGSLTMRNGEAVAFIAVVDAGCEVVEGLDFATTNESEGR